MPTETVVVVGASLAGGTAAATLRDDGFDGRIVVIGDEPELPYQRPPLSKTYLRGDAPRDTLLVRPDDWWGAEEVEMRLGQPVRSLDATDRTVTLADGEAIRFDRCLIATGVRNRPLPVPGAELDGVVHLRTVAESDRIRRGSAGATHVVVVGMGFIGAEVAASLRLMGVDVTVIEIFETALVKVLGPRLGDVLASIHRDHGVTMRFNDGVERFEGGDRIERVVTRDGDVIECDLVVVGVGTVPATDAVRALPLASDGGVAVDARLETAVPGIYAAGDVASHEHPVLGRVRVEHFDNAIKMGTHAARAILGSPAAFDDPHWFWSDQYDHHLQMGGVAVTDDMVVRGSLEDRSFCAFFLDREGVLRSSVALNRPKECRRSLPLIRAGVRPDPAALADADVDLRTLRP
ncbi:MAG TPA: FAD-dependent oxidoreductase [Actinomycetota bacterium]|nr:FAD-dependent oxidoreductase [Actinomycetota bacterium]